MLWVTGSKEGVRQTNLFRTLFERANINALRVR